MFLIILVKEREERKKQKRAIIEKINTFRFLIYPFLLPDLRNYFYNRVDKYVFGN